MPGHGPHQKKYKGPWFEDKGPSKPGRAGATSNPGGAHEAHLPEAVVPHSVKTPVQGPKPK